MGYSRPKMNQHLKPLYWISSSLEDLKSCPSTVQDDIGYALHRAQEGKRHPKAKILKGFGGGGVLEIMENDDGNTYRAVYTVKFALAIYVLHVFQKKSKSGIATPKSDVELMKQRLKLAEQHYIKAQRGEKA